MTMANVEEETTKALTESIKFPVTFNFHYGKIYDARNFEVATVKNYETSDGTKMLIGDWMAEVLNEAWRKRK